MTPEETRRLSERTWLAFNSGDLDGWLACVHPEFEGRSAFVEAEGATDAFNGIDGARAWWQNLRETFASIEVSLQQVIAVGEHSVGIADVRWIGKGSGIEIRQPVYFVSQAREGAWSYVRSHLEPAAAFAEVAERMAQGASSPSQ